MHITSSSRKKHYILFTEIHIKSSSQKYTYPLHRNAHYILFSEINIISSSQINKINPSPQKGTDINSISSFQIYKLYLRHRNTQILFSAKHTISTSQINTQYPLHRNADYILFTEMHIISFSR